MNRRTLSVIGRLTLVLALVLVAGVGFGASSVQAQAFPAYTSGIQVANLSTTLPATISLNAYNADGSSGGTPLADTIPANSSKTYFPISNVAAGFSGSVVIGSSQSVAGIVNLLAVVSNTFPAAAAYVGRSAGGTTVLLPLLNQDNSGFNTWYSIQNAGSSDATVNVAYSDGTAAGPFTIKAGAAKVVYQKLGSETHTAKVFAATITGNQPLVASVVQESNKIMFAYTGFAAGSTNPVFPLVNANNANYITGIQIQNAGTQATDVTLSYTPASAGTACTETRTVQPGASATFALSAFNPSVPADASSNCAKAKFIGSARVTGNTTAQNLVGIGNQLLPGVNGEAYGSFSDSDAGKSVVMPLIMDRNGGYFTGFNVQNVGTNPTTVTCTFQNNARTVGPTALAAGQALNDVQLNTLAAGYIGSAVCTGDAADTKLVGVVNELKTGTVDNLLVYEGVKP